MRYRNAVMIVPILGKDVLIVKKNEEIGWQFPQGGVEGQENPADTVVRELREELNIGANDVKLLGLSRYEHMFDWPRELQEEKGFAGQKQSIHFVRLCSGDFKVDGVELQEAKFVPFEDCSKHFKFEDLVNISKKLLVEAQKRHLI